MMTRLDEYLQIRRAAEFLGVSQATLRNWGRDGKITEHRNPVNGYRLYEIKDLQDLLNATARSGNENAKPLDV